MYQSQICVLRSGGFTELAPLDGHLLAERFHRDAKLELQLGTELLGQVGVRCSDQIKAGQCGGQGWEGEKVAVSSVNLVVFILVQDGLMSSCCFTSG